MALTTTELDQQIWDEELEGFLPKTIFDAHTHLWSGAFVTPETVCNNDWLEQDTGFATLQGALQTLYPGRSVRLLALPMPVIGADHDGLNRWVAAEVSADARSRYAMLITPQTAPEQIEQMVEQFGFVALKPYHHFAAAGSTGIAGYFTPAQMEVADALGLPVIIHCRSSIAADFDELAGYTSRYPGIRWVLAHAGAAFDPRRLESVIHRLRDLPGVWCDTSLIGETYTHALLLKHMDRKRIMFGSDSAMGIGGCRRGKVVSYAHSVLWQKELSNSTFWVYEQLRAIRRACELLDVPPDEVEDIFHNNADRLYGPK